MLFSIHTHSFGFKCCWLPNLFPDCRPGYLIVYLWLQWMTKGHHKYHMSKTELPTPPPNLFSPIIFPISINTFPDTGQKHWSHTWLFCSIPPANPFDPTLKYVQNSVSRHFQCYHSSPGHCHVLPGLSKQPPYCCPIHHQSILNTALTVILLKC